MKIVADERIAALDSTFARHGELITLPGREIRAQHLVDADALITRTVTRVDMNLLDTTAVQFVGTATIGTDHLDRDYLDDKDIHWSAAPGCNADATAQYTLAIFLLACRRLGRDPFQQRYGIVGCGNVGSRLKRLLEALKIDVIACDPPLAAQGTTGLRTLQDIFNCDAISLHVPLTHTGKWPTYRMFGKDTFPELPFEALVINACRGDVIEPEALQAWIGLGGHAALDVWPGEPDIDPGLVQAATVASPHIAGYSLEGKLRATSMVYREFCAHFGISNFEEIQPPPGPELNIQTQSNTRLDDIVLSICPIERDDRAMRERLGPKIADRINAYDALRSHYPERRDFSSWTLNGTVNPELESMLKNMGFSITNH